MANSITITSIQNDTGTSPTDGITNDNTLLFKGGGATSNGMVQVFLNGTQIGTSTASGSNWTFDWTGHTLADGNYTLMVKDVASNTTATFQITVDTSAAAPTVTLASDTGPSSTDHITSNGTLNITGIESGASVQYSTNGGSTWTSSFTAAEGSNTVLVRQTDVAGNVSGATSFNFTLDTTAPSAPTVALTSDTGSSSADKITNNGALTLTGAETGASVQYSINGGTTWTSSFTPAQGSNTVLVRQTDVAGNTSASTSFSFTLDTTAPSAPGVALTSDTGTSGTDKITNNGALTFTGLETGASVQYSTNGGSTWTSSFTPVQGSNTVLVRQTDVAGNNSTSTSFSFTLDTTAPVAPTVALTSDTGSSSTDKITSNGALTITGVESSASVQYSTNGGSTWTSNFTAADGSNTVLVRQTDVAGNNSASTSLTFTLDTSAQAPSVALVSDTGSSNTDKITNNGALNVTGVETGATVQYSFNNGNTWNTSFTAQEGSNTVQVRQIDAAGNTSAATSFSFTLDTTAPRAPTVALTSDTGSSGTDKITNNGALTLTGVETGASVQYSTNGGATWTSNFTAAEGSNTVLVRQTDVAGNTSGSSSLTFTLDTTAPAAPSIALASDTGASGSDHITSNGALTIGNVESGASVQYSTDGGQSWKSSFTVSEDSNTVQVRQTDVAGNVGAAATLSFTLDTAAPGAPSVALSSDTGSSGSDHITSNGALAIAGVEGGAKVEYSIDGGNAWTSGFAATEGINNVLVRQTDVAGNIGATSSLVFTLDTTAPTSPSMILASDTGSSGGDHVTSNGTLAVSGVENGAKVEYSTDNGTSWTSSFTASEGENNVLIRQTDMAGNTGATSSLSFTLDTAAPDAPAVSLASDTGASGNDNITNNGNLTLSGVENGASVEYSTDGGHTWTSSFTAAEGDNTVQVRQTDMAGNVSAASTLSFTLDTTEPAAPSIALANDTGASGNDHVSSNGALNVDDVENGAKVEYSIDGGATWSGSFSAVEGTNNVFIRQTDIAGNTGASSSLSFTLDTTAPDAPAVTLALDTGASGSDGITSNSALTLSGVENGASVEYSTDNGATWGSSFSASEGLNHVQVRQTDLAGNTGATSSLSFTLDTTTPAAPSMSLADDTGASDNDHVTRNGTLTVTGVEDGAKIEYSINDGSTWSSSFTATEGENNVLIRQTDAAGNTSATSSISFTLDTIDPAAPDVSLALDSGASTSDAITNNGNLTLSGVENGASVEYSTDGGHTWTSSFTAAEGDNTVQVRQTDMAGNVSTASTLSFTLDTTAPDVPTLTLSSDTGLSGSDHVTSDGTIVLAGAEVGASVQYSVDGGNTWSSSFTAAEGANNVLVRQTDVAGNTSTTSSLSFTLDTTAPAAPSMSLASDTGASGSDHVTSNGTLDVSDVEHGAKVEYSTDGGHTWSSSFTAAEGLNHVQVRQTDVAGNTGTASSLSFTLDTAAPNAPGVSLTSDTGSVTSDGITSSGALTLSGIENGASVEYSTDNGATWSSSFTAAEGTNTVLIRQTDVAGNIGASSSLSFTLDTTNPAALSIALTSDTGASGNDHITNDGTLAIGDVEHDAMVQYSTDGGQTWSFSFAAAEGVNNVQIRQIDLAGNTGAAASLSFTLDTATPDAPSVTLAADSGSSDSDGITDNGNLTLSGIEDGAAVEYSVDGGHTWSASFTAAEGINHLLTRQIDIAGNIGTSTALSFTVDTTVPDAPSIALAADTGTSSSGGITNNGTLTITGLENGASVQYSTDGGATWAGSFTATEGNNSVLVRQTDIAGNVSTASSLDFTLDTIAPTALTIALIQDSGISSTDAITNNGALKITGLESDAIVQYSVDSGTTWSDSFAAIEGSNNVQIRQVDVAGNASAASSFSFTLDTIAPAMPTLSLAVDSGTSNSDGITNNSAIVVGNTEGGASVQYSIDGGTTWSTSFTANEGSNNVLVRQVDVAGNIGAASTLSFTLDTQAPLAPVATLTVDSGMSDADHITNNGALALSGTESDATIQYSTDGGTTWTANVTAVEGLNTVQIRQIDLAGNVGAASTFSFTLDTTAPDAPAVSLASDTGASGNDDITNNGNLTLSGVENGASVEYSTNGGQTWSSSFTASEGLNHVQVRQTDVAGNTGASSSLSFTLDTTAPDALAVTLALDTGASNSDGITSNVALTLSGVENGVSVEYSTDNGATWSSSFTATEGENNVLIRQTDVAGNIGATSSLSFTLDRTTPTAPGLALSNDSGTSDSDHITNNGALALTSVESGASVEYSIDGGHTWTSDFAATEGSNTVQIRQIDVAGNIGEASSISFTLDTTNPSAPSLALASDTGAADSDHITSNGTLDVSDVEHGAKVEYSTDGGHTWSSGFTAAEGLNHVQVRQTDVAGNTGTASSLSFTLDTAAPNAPGVSLTSDTGSVTSDGITSSGALTLSGIENGASVEYSVDGGQAWSSSFAAIEGSNTVQVRQTDVAGNVGVATTLVFTLDTTAPDAPTMALSHDTGASGSDHVTIDGTLTLSDVENGASVEYSTDNGATWSASFTAAEGINHVLTRQIDIAGNIGGSAALSFTLDTTVPDAPSIALAADTGTSSSDGITNNGTLAITGLENGASVQYSIDGGATWDSDFTAIEGSNSVLVRQTDIAGNASPTSSLNFTLDTVAPTAPTVALTVDSGTSNSDRITNNGALAVSGLESGASVQYSTDGGVTWKTSFTAVEGANSVQVRQLDMAGNIGTATALNFTVDTIAPTTPTLSLASDTGASNSDHITNNGTVSLSGKEAGATIQYSINDGATWTSSFTAVEGNNTVLARQTDTAGNVSATSSLSFTLDTIAPSAPIIALARDSGASSSDGITNNGALAVNGVVSGATVQYSTDGGATWTAGFTAVEGSNTVRVRQTDVAGNVSATSSLNFTLDTKAPAMPTIALAVDSGASGSDRITNNGTLTIGGMENGATAQYSIDGGQTWTTSFHATEGNNNVRVRQVDLAGNISAASSLAFTMDTTVPTAAFSSAQPSGNSGAILLGGTAEANSVVTIYDLTLGTVAGTLSVGNTGTWTFTTSKLSGIHIFSLSAKDIAGNVGTPATEAIIGTKANETIYDIAGHNDLLSGVQGIDTFVFSANFGSDVITDFIASGKTHEVIQFSKSTFTDYAAVMAHAKQVGADVVIDAGGGNALTLIGININDLKAVDFAFAVV